MERLAYLLDTNAVADYLNGVVTVTSRLEQAIENRSLVYLSQPVHFEVVRGLAKANATRKMDIFTAEFAPKLSWVALIDEDWQTAANFWVQTTRIGKQLSDIDYLIAALSKRLNAVLVTADNDFDALPIKRENWRA
ncbi:MAG: PIN domain-containing protein [Anaerolineae bacterium]|nr:PIN domain-containing protein [Anaerolineae bacterium]